MTIRVTSVQNGGRRDAEGKTCTPPENEEGPHNDCFGAGKVAETHFYVVDPSFNEVVLSVGSKNLY